MARPPVKSTKEEVHNALFIGKNPFHTNPPMINRAAIVKSQATLFSAVRSVLCIHVPVNIPNRQVAMDGMVLNMPSGSKVLDPDHIWLVVSTVLSSHAARLVDGSRLEGPIPGIGMKFMIT